MRYVFALVCQFKFKPPNPPKKQTNTPPPKPLPRFLIKLKISSCIGNLLTCAQNQNRHTIIEQLTIAYCYLTLHLNDNYMFLQFQNNIQEVRVKQ